MQACMAGLMTIPRIELGGRSDLAVKTGREKKGAQREASRTVLNWKT